MRIEYTATCIWDPKTNTFTKTVYTKHIIGDELHD